MITSSGLRTRTLIASGVLAVAVAIVLGLLLMTIRSLQDANDRARRSEVVIAQATTLEKHLIDMETGVRGYVITREQSFLEPFRAGRRAYPAAATQLERLVAGNPTQRTRAESIRTAIRAWDRDFASPVIAMASGDAGAARHMVRTGAGKARVDAIRQRFARFVAEEEGLAGSRRDRADDAATRAEVAGVAGLLLLVALVVLLTRYLFRAVSREERAAADARVAQERMAVLARASEELAASLDYEKTLAEVARIAVPTIADWCSVELADEAGGAPRNVAVAHVDPAKVALARDLQARYPPDPEATTGTANVIRTGQSEVFTEITDEMLTALIDDPEQLRLIRELGLRSAMTVPLTARGRTLGAISLIAAESERRYTEDDLPFAEDLGRRAGIAIDNALLYSQERQIAETLQRSLLPDTLPTVERTEVGARYVPAADEAEVGGDWYDAVALPHGRLGLVIGDVVGHGIRAAAIMGQMRSAVRAYALEGHAPDATIERLKTMLQIAGPSGMVGTLLVVTYDPATRTIAYSSAGHPPPLLRGPDGSARFLEGGVAAPLGVDRRGAPVVELELEPGATLILYTDGLVERRGESLTVGLARLEDAVKAGPERVQDLLDHVLRSLEASTPRGDDVALLCLSALGPRGERELELRLPAERGSVTHARRSMAGWFADMGASETERYELSVAVSDACANAIEHAYGPEDATFDVRAEMLEGEVLIEVRDSGAWRPARGTNRGRGLLLMEAYTDALDIDRGEHGTTVRMRRRITA